MNYKDTWHGFHFIMCLLTGLIWLPVWIWRALSNNAYNRRVEMNLLNEQLQEMKRQNRR